MPPSKPASDVAALERYRQKRDFAITPEPGRSAASARSSCRSSSRSTRRRGCTTTSASSSTACCWLGGAEGPELRPGRQAHGDPRRGPPVSLRQLRRHDPAEAVRRRHGDRLGPRHLGAGRRSARRHGDGQAACSSLHGEKLAGLWELVRIAKPRRASRSRGCCSRSATRGRGRSAEYDVVSGAARQRRSPSRSALRRGARAARRRAGADAAGDARRERRADARRRGARRRCPPKLAPQLATLADRRAARRRLDLRDQVRRLPPAWRASTSGKVAPHHARRPRLDGARCRRSPTRARSARRRLGLARRRDRRARRRRRARLQRAAERLRLRRAPSAIVLLPVRPAVLRGHDLREVPLRRAPRAARALLDDATASERVRFSDDFDADAGAACSQTACRHAASKA